MDSAGEQEAKSVPVEESGLEATAITTKDAVAILMKEKEQRESVCMKAIQSALEQYRCKLDYIESRKNGIVVDARFMVSAR